MVVFSELITINSRKESKGGEDQNYHRCVRSVTQRTPWTQYTLIKAQPAFARE